MDPNCSNCELLKNQCLELKSEIALLNTRLDKLLESVYHKKHEVGCQTEFVSYEVECQTDMDSCLGHDVGCLSESQTISINNSTQTEPSHSDTTACETVSDYLSSQVGVHKQQQVTQHYPVNISHISLPNQPFSNFDIEQLDKDIVYDQKFSTRSTCYFGEYPYSYGNVKHEACPIPQSGNYLISILEHVHSILPNFEFNSVLVTKYNNGSDFLKFHSDNESEIVPDSNILTISLGATRVCKFRKLPLSIPNPEHSLFVRHGDAVIMSRKSQDLFQHSIISDDCQFPRVSITLRLLRPTQQSQVVDKPSPQVNESYTVYIGDSMFRHLDQEKLSSNSQKAIVLFYPGATAGGILNRLQNDPNFNSIDPTKVRKIVLFGGTNNVDRVMDIPFNLKSSFVTDFNHISENMLNQAKIEISELINFLHAWSNMASINIVNILPRISFSRNIAINALNYYIKHLSIDIDYVSMISTESHRNLFSFGNGFRKDNFFALSGNDNVHLNNSGLIRLAKYLKYYVHNSC